METILELYLPTGTTEVDSYTNFLPSNARYNRGSYYR